MRGGIAARRGRGGQAGVDGGDTSTSSGDTTSYDPSLPLAMKRDGGNAHVDHGPFYAGQSTVTGATNTDPIVITTSAPHGLQTDDKVAISDVGGNTNANGENTITRLSDTTFSIPVAGNAAYTSGGTVKPIYEDCWIDGWIKTPSATGGGYAAGAGTSGGHAWLIGFGGDNPPGYLLGSLWGGSNLIGTWNTFVAQGYQVGPNEWVHFCINVKDDVLRIHLNGVCCYERAMTNVPRFAPTTSGDVHVFGFGPGDHLLWDGHIGFFRIFDSKNKYPHPHPTTPAAAFTPDRRPRGFMISGGSYIACDFLADYTSPGLMVPDHSPNGRFGIKHPGAIMSTVDIAGQTKLNQGDAPYHVIVEDAPWAHDIDEDDVLDLGATVPSVATPPAGSDIYDSFGRANQTYANGKGRNLSMGTTEDCTSVGGLAAQTWSSGNVVGSGDVEDKRCFGILGGAAFYAEYRSGGVILIDGNGDPDSQVSAEGYHFVHDTSLVGGKGSVGVAFRAVDDENFRYAVLDRNGTPGGVLLTGTVVSNAYNGVDSSATAQVNNVNAIVDPATSNVLKVRCSGTTIEYYIGDTLILTQTDQTTHQNASKAGLFGAFDNGVVTSLARWLWFRVGSDN